MTEPTRLIDRLKAGPERDLLLLGAGELPPDGAQARVAARVLGAAAAAAVVTSATTTTSAGGGAALGKSGSTLALVFVKWLGIGAAIGGVTAYAGSELALSASAPAREPGQVSAPSTPEPAPPNPNVGLGKPVVPADNAEPPASRELRTDQKSVRGDVRIGASSTMGETESLARVRAEVARNPERALTLVNQHIVRFPDGAHADEAKKLQAALIERLRAQTP